jgi:hypothetical protein
MVKAGVIRSRKLISLLTLVVVLISLCVVVLADDPGTPGLPNTMSLSVNPFYIPVNGGTATITATVYDTKGNPSNLTRVAFSNSVTLLGTLSPGANGSAASCSWCPNCTCRYTDGDGVVSVILTPGAANGTEEINVWVTGYEGNPNLDKDVTVEITEEDENPPQVTNPSATPTVILNDNGRARAEGTNLSQINVTVTDDVSLASVTIDLSPIGESANQPMRQIGGTNIWTVTTNGSAGINATHALFVNATDLYGKINTTVSVPLAVLRRGDVVRDNVIDMKDMLYIARYTVGFEPEASNPPSIFVGDVVGEAGDPAGDGKVDMKDALFIARRVAGLEEEP